MKRIRRPPAGDSVVAMPAAALLPDETPPSAELGYPLATPPDTGMTVEVAPGVHWLRMPLPFRLDHINLWLIEDGPGWTIVDTGLGTEKTKQIWRGLFADRLGGKPVTRLICTHFHPDHMGLAGWIAAEWKVQLWATRMEWLWGRMLSLDESDHMVETGIAFYARAGMDAAGQDALRQRGNAYRKGTVPPPPNIRAIGAGETVRIGGRAWHVHVGSGHSPEHACLYAPDIDVLIAGDQVLPRISPNVSVWGSEPEDDPLARFLATIDRLRAIPASALVLPSHGLPFRGLHIRLDQLARHHDLHFGQVMAACADWRSAQDVARVLFARELDAHQMIFAIGESLAHLHNLERRGRLDRRLGEDGVIRFRAKGAST
jgi:glyoxylase-like metal-dependent hydrolase (beta-lactamase superfamily II)